MRKITDAGTYNHNGASVPIAFRGKSDQHNARRKTPVGKYVDVGQGSGTEDLYAIMAKYNIKGFEFGNWVTQEERAEYVSSITPTLEDLFSILGSRNIGINRNVGVAFGARGSRGARAHYEPVYNMINLTRYNGAGSLAHEYGHALDYNLGSFLDQNKDYPALSGGRSVSATLPDNTGGQLRAYVNQIIDSIRNGKNFAKMELANKEAAAQGADPVYSPYWFRRTEIFARFFEQYVCYCLYERQISSRLLVKRWTYYMSYPVYVEKEDFMKIKPVADKLMKEFAAFLNSKKGHRLHATAYPKPVIVKPKPKQEVKPLKPKAPAEVKKAATLKKKISAYEKKHGKLTPKPGGRAARITKRTQQATESHTRQTETGKKKVVIKPLGGFVLTDSGKLCTTQEVVSKWGSDNIKTWKRIYLVRLYDDDKTASISGRFLICLKNGQYYFGDMWGQAAIDFDRNMTEEWEKFIHPQGAKKPAVRRVGLNYSEYSFRDQNEAFYFAERTHKRKVDSNMQGVDGKAFNMLLKDIYEMEYMYAQYPSRRGKAVAYWDHYEKPQKVNTATQSNTAIDKREVQTQARKLGVIEGYGQSVHFTAKLKDLVELYHGHKQEVLNIVCDMWADDTIRRRGGGRVELYKEEALKEARRVLASRKS